MKLLQRAGGLREKCVSDYCVGIQKWKMVLNLNHQDMNASHRNDIFATETKIKTHENHVGSRTCCLTNCRGGCDTHGIWFWLSTRKNDYDTLLNPTTNALADRPNPRLRQFLSENIGLNTRFRSCQRSGMLSMVHHVRIAVAGTGNTYRNREEFTTGSLQTHLASLFARPKSRSKNCYFLQAHKN